jgi:non-specific serine/threonine protein kinase
MIAYYRADKDTAASLTNEALRLSRAVGDGEQVAAALNHLGMLARTSHDFARAHELLDEARVAARASGAIAEEVLALVHLGRTEYLEGDLSGAGTRLKAALAMATETGFQTGIVQIRRALGEVAYRANDFPNARAHLEHSLREARAIGDRWRAALAAVPLGHVLISLRDYGTAQAVLAESLLTWRDLGDMAQLPSALEGFSHLAFARANTRRCLQLAGAASALREARGLRINPDASLWLERWLPAARRALGAQRTAKSWAQGVALSPEQAIAWALQDDANGPQSEMLALTFRERQVVGLIAEGATDRQIAQRLVVSERTVHAHVRNILSRLGLEGRVQVAAWAVQHGWNESVAEIR